MEKQLEEYTKLVDDFAWFDKGNIFIIAKLAKALGRNYTEDIATSKKIMLDYYERQSERER